MGFGLAYLGLRVRKDKIFGKLGPTCEHKSRIRKNDNFCPECGKRVIRKGSEMLDFVRVNGCEGLSIDEFEIRQFENESRNFVLVVLSGVGTDSDLGDTHIKLDIVSGEGHLGMQTHFLEFVPSGRLNKFKQYMQKYGLWHADEFGIWPGYDY
jgi:hypothetical protein